MDIYEESLKSHYKWKGKVGIKSKVSVKTKKELMLAYTPGVSRPCLEIQKDVSKSFQLTNRWNTVGIFTDGSAILGLGNIGGVSGLPVMEGKAVLFKEFGNVDAFPMCLKTQNVDEIVNIIYNMSDSFGGINLEDISAPRCFEVEERLKELCDIPVFHDDQHGTAIVVGAAIINALKIVKKNISDVKCVINGAGAAGISICKFLLNLGIKHIIICDKQGIINENDNPVNNVQKEISLITNKNHQTGLLKDALVGADIFIGVSVGNIVTKEMILSMAQDAVVFALANPVSEISYEDAIKANARIVGTGSSAYPNQINNALVFPGLFRGAIDSKATLITSGMMIQAAYSLANVINDKDLNELNIIPLVYDKKAHEAVSKAVYLEAIKEGVVRK